MKSILVISSTPQLAEELRKALPADSFRVVHRTGHEEAEPFLAGGLVQACILDSELTNVEGIWSVDKVIRLAASCPVIVYAEASKPEWEEQAYLQGAAHVLDKPVRPKLLLALLDRLWNEGRPAALPCPASQVEAPRPAPEATGTGFNPAAQPLGILRHCSGILSHSLNAQGMLNQFLLLLREILSINRAAIFLRQPLGALHGSGGPEARHLGAVCAVGISNSLLENFELSYDAGIGAYLLRSGRVLRRESEAACNNVDAQKEFELLGAEVAVPILDRETVIGVAVFDGRVTGESLSNGELQLVFHLLEQLGLALKNIWLHDQVTANHELMTGVLRELSSACIVIGRDLRIIHANKAARRYFPAGEGRRGELDFSDLPQGIGAKIYQVLKTGSALPNFRYEPEPDGKAVYSINIVPFQRLPDGLPGSALLMAEDLTQAEQLRRLQVQAANAEQLETIGDRLTNEIGNALVPLTVNQQLLNQKMAAKKVDHELLDIFDRDLVRHLQRVGRLNSHMKVLARRSLVEQAGVDLVSVLEEAAKDARKHQPSDSAQARIQSNEKHVPVVGEKWALTLAFSEIILNGFQGNPKEPRVTIQVFLDTGGNGTPEAMVEFRDNGPGFTTESAQKAFEPFWKTRVVGLGLGLTVARRIIELHGGRVEITTPKEEQAGWVRVFLPLAKAPAAQPIAAR